MPFPPRPWVFFFLEGGGGFGHESCGILPPQPEIEPTAPALEGEVLTTEPPGRSPEGKSSVSSPQPRAGDAPAQTERSQPVDGRQQAPRFWAHRLQSWASPPAFHTSCRGRRWKKEEEGEGCCQKGSRGPPWRCTEVKGGVGEGRGCYARTGGFGCDPSLSADPEPRVAVIRAGRAG